MNWCGFIINQLIALSNTICKSLFYFNEANGALKRSGISDHRFDERETWWETVTFVGIILLSSAYIISNQIAMSREVKRIFTPKTSNENEIAEIAPSWLTRLEQSLEWPASFWKTIVGGQSFFRFSYQFLYAASELKIVSLSISGALTAVCFYSAMRCNYSFYKNKKTFVSNRLLPISQQPSNELTHINETSCTCVYAHSLASIFAVMTFALYFNSADYFGPHLSNHIKPLLSEASNKTTGGIAGLIAVVIGDFFIAGSTQMSYAFRLRKDWEPHRVREPSGRWGAGDTVDLIASFAKTVTSAMSLMAITYEPFQLSGSLSCAAIAFPGNFFCEAGTLFRGSPFVRAGRCLGFHRENEDENESIENSSVTLNPRYGYGAVN